MDNEEICGKRTKKYGIKRQTAFREREGTNRERRAVDLQVIAGKEGRTDGKHEHRCNDYM